MTQQTESILHRVANQPLHSIRVLLALLKGSLVRISCRVRGAHFTCGRNLRVFGRLKIRGPGKVYFGDNVVIGMLVTPYTHQAMAKIYVGSGTFLNGTRFGCAQEIRVGNKCIVADARIMDTDFHSTEIDRHSPSAIVRTLPVIIGDNVWIAAAVGILAGTHIGANAVVGYGSVCSGELDANCLYAGNPARKIREIRKSCDRQKE